MFFDMEGLPPFTEKLGPDEAYTVMGQVYELLIHKVHNYEGAVNEMNGVSFQIKWTEVFSLYAMS